PDPSIRVPAARFRAGPLTGNEAGGGRPNGVLPHMAATTMKQLLEAGAHFGHQTRRWNPKMREYIFAERNGIHIIDLAQTVRRLDDALDFIRETVRRGESILLVGTKKQAQESIALEAVGSG